MEKIKILFLTRDFSQHVSRNPYYFADELSRAADLVVWPNHGKISDILSMIKFTPDFILINDRMPYICPEITGLSSVNIPKGMIMIDIHDEIEKRKKFIYENNVQYLFSNCRDAFKLYYPEFVDRLYWSPHFVNIDIFKDYGLPKSIDYLMMGNITGQEYKLRKQIYETMKFEPGFVYHGHPGYKYVTTPDEFVGENYAREINKAKIFLTEDSIYHYPLIKYYEVLACKTLLLATTSKELEDLGFIPGVNFVSIDETNFLDKARYYLSHEREREQIAQRGYEMVRERHTAQKRVAEFMENVKKILNR